MKLHQKVVIVTGSGGMGTGRAIALRFAREGALVIASDINDDGGIETVRQILHLGGRAEYVHCDVSSEEHVRELINHTEHKHGALHVLVNNASAAYRPGEPLEHWNEIIGIDLLGAMHATRIAIDAMKRSGGGAIVNISSTSALPHGRNHPGGSPAYDTAKAGVLRFTTMLAGLKSDGIRVNCIAPDWIATPELQQYVASLTAEQRVKRGVPSKLTSLEEVSGEVLRLATDESLAGRIVLWWSDDKPRLIPWCDPGHAVLE